MTDLPFSQACENNKAPILAILKDVLADSHRVLEIGAGTGQHAVHFAPALGHLQWQPSDQAQNLAGIEVWREAYPAANLLAPVEFDLAKPHWPGDFDAVFSANTLHIVNIEKVQTLFALAGQYLPAGGLLAVYGPFNYEGDYTSPSNREFDTWLKARDPRSGIRDMAWVDGLAGEAGLQLQGDHAMPANNRLLWWRKNSDSQTPGAQ